MSDMELAVSQAASIQPDTIAAREAREAIALYSQLDEVEEAARATLEAAAKQREQIAAQAEARRDPKQAIRRARDASIAALDHCADQTSAALPYREMLAANAALFDAMLS